MITAVDLGPTGDHGDQADRYIEIAYQIRTGSGYSVPSGPTEQARLRLMTEFPQRFPTEKSVVKMLEKAVVRVGRYRARHNEEPPIEGLREKFPYYVRYYELLSSLGWKKPGTD